MINVEDVIINENKSQREYMVRQNARLAKLQKMKADIENGKKVDATQVVGTLKKSGILNSNGVVAEPYRFLG